MDLSAPICFTASMVFRLAWRHCVIVQRILSPWLSIYFNTWVARIRPLWNADALEALRSYSWPGNVRQLKNCLERAVILANNGRITLAELPPEVARPTVSFPVLMSFGPAGGEPDAGPPVAASSPASLRDMERQQILSALEQTGWHRGKTAEILGISPSTLYRRLRDYDLEKRR